MVEEIKLYKNKELREFLASKELTDKTIESLNIELYFKKWCSYEDEVIYTDLEYKGYKYEMEGVLEEKWSEVELYSDFDDYEPFRTLDKFFETIKEYELHEMEGHFSYDYIGEPDTWSFVKINWLDEVPENIKKEFRDRYIETYNYNDLKGENMRYDGGGGNFYRSSNNIHSVALSLTTKSNQIKIEWINDFPEPDAKED